MPASHLLHSFDLVREANRWEELWASFLEWERRVGAWDYSENQIPLWEYVRVPVFLKLQELSGFIDTLSPSLSLVHRLQNRDFLRAALTANPCLAPHRPLLCLGIARRVWHKQSWCDPYLDPFLDDVRGTYVYLERPEGGSHLRPTRTEQVYYTDWIAAFAACLRRTGCGITEKTDRWLRHLESACQASFHVPVPITELGSAYLAARIALRRLYRKLLQRLRPRLCIIVAINPAERAFVEACRDLGIITAEMQHGMIGPYDLTYTVPPGSIQKTFPDYILLFGRYWRTTMQLPVCEEKAVEVGFPFFQEVMQRYETPARQPRVLVLSQPGYTRVLAGWTIRLACAAPPAFRVTFRPHPSEGLSDAQVSELEKQGVEIARAEKPLYELQACSTIQVGVFSTALYEGLAFGLKTYIVPLPGYQYMRPMLQRGWMRLLEDESQPFADRSFWPSCDLRELFLLAGTGPFHHWLYKLLGS